MTATAITTTDLQHETSCSSHCSNAMPRVATNIVNCYVDSDIREPFEYNNVTISFVACFSYQPHLARNRRKVPYERTLTKFRTSREIADVIICPKFGVEKLSG